MMTMNWPWWFQVLILGVAFWPVPLVIGIGLLAAAPLARARLRWAFVVAALPFLAVTAVAGWWVLDARRRDHDAAAFEARTREVLGRPEIVDGMLFPAGTAAQWRDVDHRQLAMASPPNPITLFGLRVSWIQRAEDGQGWSLQLPQPEAIEGWSCARIGVEISAAGRLRSCQLAAGRAWQGWPVPVGAHLDLATRDKVGLTLPDGASMAAPEISHEVTATGSFAFNADGSLDQLYFEMDDPLVVAGHQLWNSVQWSYDPATYGQGRRRRAVTVRGTLVSAQGNTGEDMIIQLADGRVSTAE